MPRVDLLCERAITCESHEECLPWPVNGYLILKPVAGVDLGIFVAGSTLDTSNSAVISPKVLCGNAGTHQNKLNGVKSKDLNH